MMHHKKASKGINIYGLVYILLGLGFIVRFMSGEAHQKPDKVFSSPLLFTLFLVVLAVDIYIITCGFGLFSLKEWARKGIIVLSWIYSVIGGTSLIFVGLPNVIKYFSPITLWLFFCALISYFLYCVLPIYFFTRPKVKEQFK